MSKSFHINKDDEVFTPSTGDQKNCFLWYDTLKFPIAFYTFIYIFHNLSTKIFYEVKKYNN